MNRDVGMGILAVELEQIESVQHRIGGLASPAKRIEDRDVAAPAIDSSPSSHGRGG